MALKTMTARVEAKKQLESCQYSMQRAAQAAAAAEVSRHDFVEAITAMADSLYLIEAMAWHQEPEEEGEGPSRLVGTYWGGEDGGTVWKVARVVGRNVHLEAEDPDVPGNIFLRKVLTEDLADDYERRESCESCSALATTADSEGVPLCTSCHEELVKEGAPAPPEEETPW